MIIKEIEVSKINPAAYNPRIDLKPGDLEYQKLKKSIEEFGYIDPLIWNRQTGNLVGGHQRYKILLEGSPEKLTVSVVNLDLNREKALNIALNKIEGGWDNEKLAIIFNELSIDDVELSGFGNEEIDELLVKFNYNIDVDKNIEDDGFNAGKEVEKIDNPVVKLGQVWQLGPHRLMCGDATKIPDVSKLMNGEQANLVVTDPPYNVAVNSDSVSLTDSGRDKIMNDNMDEDDFKKFLDDYFQCTAEAMADNAAIYVFHGSSFQREFENAMNAADMEVRAQCIWVKNFPSFGFSQYRWQHEPIFYAHKRKKAPKWYGDRKQATVWRDSVLNNDLEELPSTIWEISRGDVGKYEHPTQKPLDLLAIPIRNSSKRGDIVIDFCGGSGSTLMTCEQLDRECRMMELDPKFCDVIIKRYELYTGKEVVLIEK
ncbi:TPA_asm: DNA modification methylase [Listeria monocytogenes]|nr:DNA modification methylase [Listeria monocytogenes]